MPLYVVLVKWTDQGIRTIKDYPKRLEEARKIIEAGGGKILSAFVTMGAYDQVFILEGPDNKSAIATAAKICSLGNIKTETLAAISVKEFAEIAPTL